MSKKSKAEERAAKAAAALAERKRKERQRNIVVGVGVVLLMVAIVAAGFLINRSKDGGNDKRASDTSSSSSSSAYQLTIGTDDAPHTIVFYEDFLCPICQAVEAGTRDDFAKLADAGKVQVSYRPFNLFSQDDDPRKPYSVDAASVFGVVLDKSGDEVAKKFHDLLYENQPSESGPFPDQDDLVALAVQAGAKEADVKAGLDAGDGKDWVDGATSATDDLGIDSTPTIYLDGEQFQDYTTMDDLVTNLVAAVS
jgi:protein-disulfide isomerase